MSAASRLRVAVTEVQVRALLPHREPFLFVRHAIENEIGRACTAVPLQGGEQLLPESLRLLEGLGQTSALLIRQIPENMNKPLPVFAAMKNVIWDLGEGPPFTNLLYKVKLVRGGKGRPGLIDAMAVAGDRTLCSGQLMFSFLH